VAEPNSWLRNSGGVRFLRSASHDDALAHAVASRACAVVDAKETVEIPQIFETSFGRDLGVEGRLRVLETNAAVWLEFAREVFHHD
jgi:hypothetical protein